MSDELPILSLQNNVLQGRPSVEGCFIQTLPRQVLRNIFESVTLLEQDLFAAICLSHVSAQWRAIVISQHSRWSNVVIRTFRHPAILREILARSRQDDLKIRIVSETRRFVDATEFLQFDRTMCGLAEHVCRFESLSISGFPPILRLIVKHLSDRLFSRLQRLEFIQRGNGPTCYFGSFSVDPNVFHSIHMVRASVFFEDASVLSGIRNLDLASTSGRFLDQSSLTSLLHPSAPSSVMSRLSHLSICDTYLVPTLTPLVPSFVPRSLVYLKLSRLSCSTSDPDIMMGILKLFTVTYSPNLEELFLEELNATVFQIFQQFLIYDSKTARFPLLKRLTLASLQLDDVDLSFIRPFPGIRQYGRGLFLLSSMVYNNVDSVGYQNLLELPEISPWQVIGKGRNFNHLFVFDLQDIAKTCRERSMLQLPTELILNIIAYLPLNSVVNLVPVSRQWKTFFDLHKSTIFRRAAALHCYIPRETFQFDDLNSLYSPRALLEVNDWEDLFDEKEGLVIYTSDFGGLIVLGLDEDRSLWRLPMNYIRPYAHCEYGRGFVIFDRADGSKEVWRRFCDVNKQEQQDIVPQARPDAMQMRLVPRLRPGSSTHGAFYPWVLLHMPEFTRAYRFVYPILLTAATQRLYLWDVRTGQLIQTIQDIQKAANGQDDVLGDLNYVDLSEKHVIICGNKSLRVFSRATGKSVMVIPSASNTYGGWECSLLLDKDRSPLRGQALQPQRVSFRQVVYKERPLIFNEFLAAHVSSCGSHLVALLATSRLLIIYNFERIINGEKTLSDIGIDVQLGSPRYTSVYLAFEHDRVGVVTQRGLFVVEVDEASIGSKDVHPDVHVSRASFFTDPSWLAAVTCLQMTDTTLFLNWNPDITSNDELEAAYQDSLQDTTSFTVLPTGDLIPLVNDVVVGAMSHESSVFAIDFLSNA